MYPVKISRQILLITGILAIALYSCSKEDNGLRTPDITLSVDRDTLVNLRDSIIITAASNNAAVPEHRWMVNDSLYSSTARLAFKAAAPGIYVVKYTATNADWTITREIKVTVQFSIRPVTGSSSKYISKIYNYLPAPGQFVNESSGSPEGAQAIIGGTSSLLQLGAYGGYVVFGFDHSVVNSAGADLAIYGNAVKAPVAWSEPGVVMVSQDINDNGIPDDPWYELAGSEYNAATTIRRYRITYYNPKAIANVPWKDNQGRSGEVEINEFHHHNYYPAFADNQDSISFEGTLLKSTFGLLEGTSTYVNTAFAWGYADNYSTDAAKDPYETNRYNAFDLEWAVDNTGKAVQLRAIDFVKVYTGQNSKGSPVLGEISTEIAGAADLHM
jgi:hypothetical protein